MVTALMKKSMMPLAAPPEHHEEAHDDHKGKMTFIAIVSKTTLQSVKMPCFHLRLAFIVSHL